MANGYRGVLRGVKDIAKYSCTSVDTITQELINGDIPGYKNKKGIWMSHTEEIDEHVRGKCKRKKVAKSE